MTREYISFTEYTINNNKIGLEDVSQELPGK